MSYQMKKIMFAYIVGSLVLIPMVSSAPLESACMTQEEQIADKLRFIQGQFKVAAMQCKGAQNVLLPPLYNGFVKANRNQLIVSELKLKSHAIQLGNFSVQAYLQEKNYEISVQSSGVPQFCARNKAAMEMSLIAPTPLTILDILPIEYKVSRPVCPQDKLFVSGIKKRPS